MVTAVVAATGNNLAGSSADRDLASLALESVGWSQAGALALNADPAAALDRIAGMLKPLREVEPHAVIRDPDRDMGFRFDGKATTRLVDALSPLGIKVAPTMAPAQAGAWLAALVAALGDLPARVVIRAAEEAIHVPMRFPNEVEGVVRDRAKDVAARFSMAVSRLRRLQGLIAEAAKPKLPPPPERDPTPKELAALGRSDLGRSILRLALGNGHITQDAFDAAIPPVDAMEEDDARAD